MQSRPKGFTLLELLAVMGILALLAAVFTFAFEGGRNSAALREGQQLAGSLFQSARSLALLHNTRARVLIYASHELDADNDRFLRQIALVYDSDGSDETDNDWVFADAGRLLPEGVYYVPEQLPEFVKNASPDAQPIAQSLSSSGASQTTMRLNPPGSQNAKDWYFYEYQSNGSATQAAAVFALANATITGTKPLELAIENPLLSRGFAIRRNGSLSYLESYEQLRALNNSGS